jgi:hypothetical protein
MAGAAYFACVRWTCYNTAFLLFCVHAHNGNPWQRPVGESPDCHPIAVDSDLNVWASPELLHVVIVVYDKPLAVEQSFYMLWIFYMTNLWQWNVKHYKRSLVSQASVGSCACVSHVKCLPLTFLKVVQSAQGFIKQGRVSEVVKFYPIVFQSGQQSAAGQQNGQDGDGRQHHVTIGGCSAKVLTPEIVRSRHVILAG